MVLTWTLIWRIENIGLPTGKQKYLFGLGFFIFGWDLKLTRHLQKKWIYLTEVYEKDLSTLVFLPIMSKNDAKTLNWSLAIMVNKSCNNNVVFI